MRVLSKLHSKSCYDLYLGPYCECSQLKHSLDDLLFSHSGHVQTLLRSLVIRFMGKCSDEETVAEAKKRFDLHVKGESLLVADLRSPVYSIVLSVGDGATLETIKDLYRKAELHEEKVRLLTSMGSVKKSELIQDVLNFSLSVSSLQRRLYWDCMGVFPPKKRLRWY